jgi:hypothetical protein
MKNQIKKARGENLEKRKSKDNKKKNKEKKSTILQKN